MNKNEVYNEINADLELALDFIADAITYNNAHNVSNRLKTLLNRTNKTVDKMINEIKLYIDN